MEQLTDIRTISTDGVAVTSNPHLEEIETWDERDLPYYKRKVSGKIFSGYTSLVPSMIIVYACYIFFTAIGFATIDNLTAWLQAMPFIQWIILALFAVISFILVFLFSKKSAIEFIDSCHGEIGHKGYPFIKVVIANLIISIILVVAVIGLAVYVDIASGFTKNGLTIQTFTYLPGVVSPIAYFLGIIVARNQLSVCPVCGRYNTIFRVRLSHSFGERKDGSHVEYESESERIGTETITTYYSDGSTSKTEQGIYQTVTYANEYDDYSNLTKYAYLCHECSYCEESIEETKWKVFKTKYRE